MNTITGFFVGILALFSGLFGHTNTNTKVEAPSASILATTTKLNTYIPNNTQSSSTQKNIIRKQIGYIKKIYQKNEATFLEIDYVSFLTGKEAGDAPDGYRIINDNQLIRTFQVQPDLKILLSNMSMIPKTISYTNADKAESHYLSLETFLKIFEKSIDDYYRTSALYWISINSNNEIIEIKEQPIP